MSLVLDMVEQASIRHDATGITATRTGLLREIGGPVTARARAALTAPGLPRYGDVYTPIPSLRAIDVQLNPIDTKSWAVQVIYREPNEAERAHMVPLGTVVDVQWFSSNVTVDRLYDANGERLFHWYAGYPTSISVSGYNVVEVRSTTRQASPMRATSPSPGRRVPRRRPVGRARYPPAPRTSRARC